MSEPRPGYLLPHRATVAAIGGVLVGMLLAALNQTIVATALPRIHAGCDRDRPDLRAAVGRIRAAAVLRRLALAHSEPWQIVAGVPFLGLGIGMSFASMANLIVEAVPQTQTGEATGMNTIMRTIGGAFGAQLAAVIVAEHVTAGSAFPSESGFTTAFAVGAIALGLALAAAAGIPGRRRPAPAGAEPAVSSGSG